MLKHYFTWKKPKHGFKEEMKQGGKENRFKEGVSKDKGLCSGEGIQGTGDCRNEEIRRCVTFEFR